MALCQGGSRRWLVALGACLALAAPAPAWALTAEDLSGPLTPADLATSLAGPGVAVSNVTYSGADPAGGRFGDGTAAIGFDTGIVLSSGDVKKVVPPNASDNTSTTNGTPGDPALSILAGNITTYDAVILEFDFVPQAARVEFKYVFTSEEYNEFANGTVNDVFAFFVNNANCAVVPGTNQAVSVNTVNGGNPFGTNAVNPQFFRNNDVSDGGGSIPTEMDGLTTVFTCSAAVTPGQQNRMRLGIADGGDSAYDANVFLQAGSLISAACNDGVDNDSDGQTDFPADTGCADAADADEADGGGGGPKTLADLPPPEIGTTANVAPVKGEVLVSVPPGSAGARAAQVKGREFVPLSEARTIPVGSLLDTSSGTVRIQTEAATAGQVQSGNFFGGVFQLLQNRGGSKKGLTKLPLKGASFSSCRRSSRSAQASAAQRRRLSRRTIRKLGGNANGSYQTRGRHSAATVRGTIWTVTDRCDGTLTRVRRGRVTVRDFRRKRNIVVRAGKSYLATPFASAR